MRAPSDMKTDGNRTRDDEVSDRNLGQDSTVITEVMTKIVLGTVSSRALTNPRDRRLFNVLLSIHSEQQAT